MKSFSGGEQEASVHAPAADGQLHGMGNKVFEDAVAMKQFQAMLADRVIDQIKAADV